MKYSEIRQTFTDFFENQGHRLVRSSSLVPHKDPSLMFTNAGMNQFKDVFLGKESRDYGRAVTIQKCLRAGGKHNDLENVGFTPYHHTFFEMMGNFSFGDYFKREAIVFAWEFLTKKLNIPQEGLLVSVFATDKRAAEIWKKDVGLSEDKIFRYGEKDNFWRMGQTGPCGPCSEIYYDHNPPGPRIPLHEDKNRFVEIWNLVFMEFFEDEKGKKTPLPKPCVDTGAGLERIAAVLQGFKDNYQCDIFKPLIAKVCEIVGLKDNWGTLSRNPEILGAVKVVCDHARATGFLIGEGVFPSNEGPGYVLRRIMRRAIRYAGKLNDKKSLFSQVCAQVIETMGPYYPDLVKNSDSIINGIRNEEKRFLQTLDKGSHILDEKIQNLLKSGEKNLEGKTAFVLYDTYGFPFDLTEVIAKEHGLGVDEKGFKEAMKEAKKKARQGRKPSGYSVMDTPAFDLNNREFIQWIQKVRKEKGPTSFEGYKQLSLESELLAIHDGKTQVEELNSSSGWLVFNKSPFYPEGGGQVADCGTFSYQGQVIGLIDDCQKINEVFVHHVTLRSSGALRRSSTKKSNEMNMEGVKLIVGKIYSLNVSVKRRQSIAGNHSATHLLNATLREVLGNHVHQAGSLVNESKLRFDFTHNRALTVDEIREIEKRVNKQISLGVSVGSQTMPYKEALDQGAICLSGEKYADQVRVIFMGQKEDGQDFSMELCGGTHVSNTSRIRLFKIVSEGAVASGIRRIEALTGERAFRYLNELAEENLRNRRNLKLEKPKADDESFQNHLANRIDDLRAKIKKLEQKLKTQKVQNLSVDDLLKQAIEKKLKGKKVFVLFTKVNMGERQQLSQFVDELRDKKPKLVLVLIGGVDEKGACPIVVAADKNLKTIHAGTLMKELCKTLGGRGGGRADFAQGSITKPDEWKLARDQFYGFFE